MKRSKVYVVTAGDYSDYHIEKIFTSRHVANLYSMLDPDRRVEAYEVDNVTVDTKKSFLKIVYNFGWMGCISSIEFTNKNIKPHIEIGGYPQFAFILTLDLSNERIHKAILSFGKNSKLIEKTVQDKFAEYLYEHNTSKEEIIRKENERIRKQYAYPIASSSADTDLSEINKKIQSQLRQLVIEGKELPNNVELMAMIEKAKQEKTE